MLQWIWRNRCLFKILTSTSTLWINIWDSIIWNRYKTVSKCNCWLTIFVFHTAENALHCLMSGVQNLYHIYYFYHLFSFVLSEGVNLIFLHLIRNESSLFSFLKGFCCCCYHCCCFIIIKYCIVYCILYYYHIAIVTNKYNLGGLNNKKCFTLHLRWVRQNTGLWTQVQVMLYSILETAREIYGPSFSRSHQPPLVHYLLFPYSKTERPFHRASLWCFQFHISFSDSTLLWPPSSTYGIVNSLCPPR